MKIPNKFIALSFIALSTPGYAAPNNTELAVWANEAIVATYTYNYKNFLDQQKEIAKYFTAKGWTDYSNAINAAQLPELVKKNSYFVSAVATSPPEVGPFAPNAWKAVMPLLVVYKNPQYQQQQTLSVTIYFKEVPSNQGVRGLAIESIQTKVAKPPCQCEAQSR